MPPYNSTHFHTMCSEDYFEINFSILTLIFNTPISRSVACLTQPLIPLPHTSPFLLEISYLVSHILNTKKDLCFYSKTSLRYFLGVFHKHVFLSSVLRMYKMTGRMGGEWELFASLKNKHLINWLPYFFINTKPALWCRMLTALLWGAPHSFHIGSELCWLKPCFRVRAYDLASTTNSHAEQKSSTKPSKWDYVHTKELTDLNWIYP